MAASGNAEALEPRVERWLELAQLGRTAFFTHNEYAICGFGEGSRIIGTC